MIQLHSRSATFVPPSSATYLMGDFTDWDEAPKLYNEAVIVLQKAPPHWHREQKYRHFTTLLVSERV